MLSHSLGSEEGIVLVDVATTKVCGHQKREGTVERERDLHLCPPKARSSLAMLVTNTALNWGTNAASSSNVPKHQKTLSSEQRTSF